MDLWRAVDAVESWLVESPYWLQVLILLAVLVPVLWLLAGLIDRLVDGVLGLRRSGAGAGSRRAPGESVPGDPR
ncbi:hypothetical protein [Nakamurella leprariae]|uniref:Uncharacterized protein n=1 Tax=Nakamurella leprariae TaxID=2803911 RepID=A0A938YB18_9ACTN|nr:hypothetical protein [Nakamurella leprariae]MBM9467327.1 hypothetical protein [Nakamurella leprariae]